MFNIANFAADVFAKGAKAVLKEARDALNWAQKVAAAAMKLPFKIAGKMLTLLRKYIETLKKVIAKLDTMVKKLIKAVMPDPKTVKAIVEDLAKVMSKVVNLTDRLAAFVEAKFMPVLSKAQDVLQKIAAKITTLAKKVFRGIQALQSALNEALKSELAQEFKKELTGAVRALTEMVPVLKFLQDAKAKAAKVITTIDPDDIIGKVSKWSMAMLDNIIDNARYFKEIARLSDGIGFLRNLLGALRAGLRKFTDNVLSNLARGLIVLIERIVADLEAVYKEAMAAAAEALKLRVQVGTEAKLLEARVNKAQSEAEVYARTIKRLVW